MPNGKDPLRELDESKPAEIEQISQRYRASDVFQAASNVIGALQKIDPDHFSQCEGFKQALATQAQKSLEEKQTEMFEQAEQMAAQLQHMDVSAVQTQALMIDLAKCYKILAKQDPAHASQYEKLANDLLNHPNLTLARMPVQARNDLIKQDTTSEANTISNQIKKAELDIVSYQTQFKEKAERISVIQEKIKDQKDSLVSIEESIAKQRKILKDDPKSKSLERLVDRAHFFEDTVFRKIKDDLGNEKVSGETLVSLIKTQIYMSIKRTGQDLSSRGTEFYDHPVAFHSSAVKTLQTLDRSQLTRLADYVAPMIPAARMKQWEQAKQNPTPDTIADILWHAHEEYVTTHNTSMQITRELPTTRHLEEDRSQVMESIQTLKSEQASLEAEMSKLTTAQSEAEKTRAELIAKRDELRKEDHGIKADVAVQSVSRQQSRLETSAHDALYQEAAQNVLDKQKLALENAKKTLAGTLQHWRTTFSDSAKLARSDKKEYLAVTMSTMRDYIDSHMSSLSEVSSFESLSKFSNDTEKFMSSMEKPEHSEVASHPIMKDFHADLQGLSRHSETQNKFKDNVQFEYFKLKLVAHLEKQQNPTSGNPPPGGMLKTTPINLKGIKNASSPDMLAKAISDLNKVAGNDRIIQNIATFSSSSEYQPLLKAHPALKEAIRPPKTDEEPRVTLK